MADRYEIDMTRNDKNGDWVMYEDYKELEDQRDNLSSEIEGLNDKIDCRGGEVSELEGNVHHLEQEVSDLEETISELRSDLSHLQMMGTNMTSDGKVYILVLYQDWLNVKEHAKELVSQGGTYFVSRNKVEIGNYIYMYQKAKDDVEVVGNLMGLEFHHILWLQGTYPSDIINYAMSRVRRVI